MASVGASLAYQVKKIRIQMPPVNFIASCGSPMVPSPISKCTYTWADSLDCLSCLTWIWSQSIFVHSFGFYFTPLIVRQNITLSRSTFNMNNIKQAVICYCGLKYYFYIFKSDGLDKSPSGSVISLSIPTRSSTTLEWLTLQNKSEWVSTR